MLDAVGEVDFILKCVAPDMATFQDFVTHLTAAPHVRNVRTSLVLHNSKYEAAVPLELKVLDWTGVLSSPSLRGAQRRSNPIPSLARCGLLRSPARNDEKIVSSSCASHQR